MSDFDPEDYGLQPVQEQVPRNWRRQMEADKRAAEDERDALKAQLDEVMRSQAFAGIPTDGIGEVFRKGYDGELTAEAVQARWSALGQSNGDLQRSLAGHQQGQAMAAGAPAAQTSSTAAEIAELRARSRLVKNAGALQEDKRRLGQIIAREGPEHNPSNWVLPSQLV